MSAWRLLAFLSLVIFGGEAAIMFALDYAAIDNELGKSAVDSTALVIIVFPFLYFFVFRTIIQKNNELTAARQKLLVAQENLEQRIEERTNEITIANRKLKHSVEQLDTALSNMSQGLIMFDSTGRLVVCNDRYRKMYKLSPDLAKPDCSVVDLLKHRVANGTFSGNPEKYVSDLLATITQGTPTTQEVETGDGRIIAVMNHTMAGGGWVSTHEDVTARKNADATLRESEARFADLFEFSPDALVLVDATGVIQLANSEAKRLFSDGSDDLVSRPVESLIPEDLRSKHRELRKDFGDSDNQRAMGAAQTHFTALRRDGSIFPADISVSSITTNGKRMFCAVVRDITERMRTEDELRRTQKFLDTVIDNVPAPIIVKDVPNLAQDARDCRFTFVNRACEELFGVPRQQLIGKSAAELYPKERADFIVAHDTETLQSDQPILIRDHPVVTPGNGTRLITSKKVAIRNDDGNPQYLLTILDDVTERRLSDSRVAHMAHYDTLTDLPNRATFNDTMDVTLDSAATTGEQFAVLSIDLDRFKEANDTYGHLIGDALLREVARRMQAASGGAFLARIGGDEFALIVADGAQPATALANRLLTTVVDDFEVEGHRLKLGLSIGGAVYPTDGTDAKTLMISADAALYRAKAEMRGTALFFEPEMSARLRERHALQEDLRSAIDRGELLLHYQPQLKIAGETIGFEALARWQCPKRGMVEPSTFIPIAEESSLIISVGEWVLREACREAASWPQPLTVAVNISPIQFRHGDLPRLVHTILLETGLAPGRLELEVTEGVMINDFSRAISILNRLKSLGVRIAMDDFGTGYSSLSYLQSFRCDKIKIDRIFISDLEHNHHSRAIVRAVIGLGRSLDLPILAEGVETEAQRAFLAQEGCDEVQGYLTGRPLPIADYATLVGRQAVAQQKINYLAAS